MSILGDFQTDEHINRKVVFKVWLAVIALTVFMFVAPVAAKWMGWLPQKVDALPHRK